MDDVQELIAEMRSKGQPPQHLGNRLADALESLLDEKAKTATAVEAAIRLLIPWGDN